MKKTRYKNIGYTGTKNRGDDCECKLDDKNAQKSRVTIVGQLGLTQDERYVLNCSATVNDEPIATNVTRKRNNQNRLDMKQNINEFAVLNNNEIINKGMSTQATQVNLTIKNNKKEKIYRDQTIQCNCNEPGNLLNASEGNVLKGCNSPLVVISIYPRENDIEDINVNPIQIIQHPSLPKHISKGHKGISKADPGRLKIENTLHSQYINKQIHNRSRSPSPAIRNRNSFFNRAKDVDVTTTSNFTEKHTPQTPKNFNKLVIQSNEVKKISSFDNNKSFKRKSELDKHYYGKQNRYNQINCDQQNINTERVKKALVSNFMKNIGDDNRNVSKTEFLIPKDKASKITINIDGENENYDVVFEQSKFNTGLTVNKTAKVKHKYKSKKKDEDNSIDNFLTLADDTIRNKFRFQPPNSNPKILPTKPRINVRDSLEIGHRKDGRDSGIPKGNNKKVKNINNNETKPCNKLLEPVKHFRDDDCSLLDPNERDREVRELLGTFRKTNNEISYINTVAQDSNHCNKKCSKSLMTGRSISKLLSNENTKNEYNTKSFLKTLSKLDFLSSRDENYISRNEFSTPQCTTYSNASNKDPYKTQNLILNRNVQVFLQVEQFNKTQPIILTRKQYDKMKKTICCTISKKCNVEKSKKCIRNFNIVSVGEVKIKPKLYQPLQLEREIQTDKTHIKKLRKKGIKPKNVQIFDSTLNKSNDKTKNKDLLSTDVNKKNLIKNNETRRVVSSIEIHCTSVDYMKHVSTTCFGENERKSIYSSNKQENNNSIQTIFKGFKKCVTPNLGTSAYSLDFYRTSSIDFMKPSDAGDCKAKKPLLRRLISCFVMRARPSEFKTTAVSLRKHARMTNSMDSYQINTSLGGLEMSSSLYDTSISFYSNHNVLPVNKSRRGFFSSVRGFLASRRS